MPRPLLEEEEAAVATFFYYESRPVLRRHKTNLLYRWWHFHPTKAALGRRTFFFCSSRLSAESIKRSFTQCHCEVIFNTAAVQVIKIFALDHESRLLSSNIGKFKFVQILARYLEYVANYPLIAKRKGICGEKWRRWSVVKNGSKVCSFQSILGEVCCYFSLLLTEARYFSFLSSRASNEAFLPTAVAILWQNFAVCHSTELSFHFFPQGNMGLEKNCVLCRFAESNVPSWLMHKWSIIEDRNQRVLLSHQEEGPQ